MSDFVETFQLTFECFHGHSARNNGLVKFRDVNFDDASILFNFCSILSKKRCIVYFNNMTRLIRTLSMTPSVPVLTDLTVYSWLAFNRVLFYALEFSQGSNSLPYAFSDHTVNRKRERKRKKRIAQDQRSFMWHVACSKRSPPRSFLLRTAPHYLNAWKRLCGMSKWLLHLWSSCYILPVF